MLAFQQGSRAAFDDLVRLYHAPVLNFLSRYLRDPDRAEDLAQEVFVRVFGARNRYRPTACFTTWLFTIATRLALNEIRGQRRRRRVFTEPGRTSPGASETSGWEEAEDRREPCPESRLELDELSEVLARFIDELPPKQRAAVILNRLEDMSYKEVAAALGVTLVAVKSLLMRARETLRQRLDRYLQGDPLSPKKHP